MVRSSVPTPARATGRTRAASSRAGRRGVGSRRRVPRTEARRARDLRRPERLAGSRRPGRPARPAYRPGTSACRPPTRSVAYRCACTSIGPARPPPASEPVRRSYATARSPTSSSRPGPRSRSTGRAAVAGPGPRRRPSPSAAKAARRSGWWAAGFAPLLRVAGALSAVLATPTVTPTVSTGRAPLRRLPLRTLVHGHLRCGRRRGLSPGRISWRPDSSARPRPNPTWRPGRRGDPASAPGPGRSPGGTTGPQAGGWP
jgi:hypothetical protein